MSDTNRMSLLEKDFCIHQLNLKPKRSAVDSSILYGKILVLIPKLIPGLIINLNSFKNNGNSEVEFDLNVPFDDLLAIQAFDLFANGVIGDLSIRFQVSLAGLVWAVLDPYTVAEAKVFLEDNDEITMD